MDGPRKFFQRALPKGSAMEPLPQRALPRKRSTLAFPSHWTSPPTRSTARPTPTHLPKPGMRGGTAHRAGRAAFRAKISGGWAADCKCPIHAFRSDVPATTKPLLTQTPRSIVCWLLFVGCCLLAVVYCLLVVVGCLLVVVGCLLFVGVRWLPCSKFFVSQSQRQQLNKLGLKS